MGKLEKAMATHSSVLAWRIPGMAEPGGLPSTGSHRVGHDWCDLAAAAAADGETVETVSDFIFFGSKITAEGDCSHEIKRRLFLQRIVMTNLESIWKSRDITLSTKVHLVKAIVFISSHVWMWELDYKESWALKNWCFWTVVLEETLESSLDCKEIQPINPKISPEYSLEGLMLKLMLQ